MNVFLKDGEFQNNFSKLRYDEEGSQSKKFQSHIFFCPCIISLSSLDQVWEEMLLSINLFKRLLKFWFTNLFFLQLFETVFHVKQNWSFDGER